MTYVGETVTLIREFAGFDKYGDPIPATPTEITLADVKVAPRAQGFGGGFGESLDRGNEGVIIGWDLYAPAGTVSYYTDKVRVRGVVCRVEGEIADWPSGVVIKCARA